MNFLDAKVAPCMKLPNGPSSAGAATPRMPASVPASLPIVVWSRSGVLIHPGDLVLEMLTAWLLFPRQMEARILELALEKVADEKRVRSEIEAGATSTAVFDRHGIL